MGLGWICVSIGCFWEDPSFPHKVIQHRREQAVNSTPIDRWRWPGMLANARQQPAHELKHSGELTVTEGASATERLLNEQVRL